MDTYEQTLAPGVPSIAAPTWWRVGRGMLADFARNVGARWREWQARREYDQLAAIDVTERMKDL